MFNGRFRTIRLIICVFLILTNTVFSQKPAPIQSSWEDKLYEKNIAYENFACQDEDKKAVSDYFKNHPLNRILRVCHNNCAILESFSTRKLLPLSNKIKGDGFIVIHILANENGRPIFARAVNGHPLVRRLAEKRACESKFKENSEKRQQVIFYCPNDKCSAPQPVQK